MEDVILSKGISEHILNKRILIMIVIFLLLPKCTDDLKTAVSQLRHFPDVRTIFDHIVCLSNRILRSFRKPALKITKTAGEGKGLQRNNFRGLSPKTVAVLRKMGSHNFLYVLQIYA